MEDDDGERPWTSPVTVRGTSVYTDSPSLVNLAVSMPSPPFTAVTVTERGSLFVIAKEFVLERPNSTLPVVTSFEFPSRTVAVNVMDFPT